MTTTHDLEKLAAAEAPSRELDAEIWSLVWECVKPDARHASHVPAYTSSIDSALMLVPEGFAWEVHGWSGGQQWCRILGTHEHEGERWHNFADGKWDATAATPALAICIAALRARGL